MNTLANELAPKVFHNGNLVLVQHPHTSHPSRKSPLTPSPQGVLVLVTVGGDKGAGQFLLAGSEADVATLGPKSV